MTQRRRNIELATSVQEVEQRLERTFETLYPSSRLGRFSGSATSWLLGSICNAMPVAFNAYLHPESFGANLGVEEKARDGSVIHHLNRELLGNEMEGVLRIQLQNATDVQNSDNVFFGRTDPYVVFTNGISMEKSGVLNNKTNPSWNSTHYLFVRNRSLLRESDELTVDLFDYDSAFHNQPRESLESMRREDDHLGFATMSLAQLKRAGLQSHSLDLMDPSSTSPNGTVLHFTSEFISVEEYCAAVDRSSSDSWLDDTVMPPTEADWPQLAVSTAMGHNTMIPVTYFTSTSSGTQAWVCMNRETNTICITLRGTEFDEAEDVSNITNILPESTDILNNEQYVLRATDLLRNRNSLVHSGFLNAYQSVHESLLQEIYSITNWTAEWAIVSTGHSLGGALATIASFEMANLHTSTGQCPRIAMINVGCPAVGRFRFIPNYTKSVPSSFRVVNAEDIVTTIPHNYIHVRSEVLLEPSGELIMNGQTLTPSTLISRQGRNETRLFDDHREPYYYRLVQNIVRGINSSFSPQVRTEQKSLVS